MSSSFNQDVAQSSLQEQNLDILHEFVRSLVQDRARDCEKAESVGDT